MFIQLLKYNLFRLLRTKEVMFWSLIFPIALGTLFGMTFGNYMEGFEIFNKVPVAYVQENREDLQFEAVLDEINETGELLSVKKVTMTEAEKLLNDKKIDGIYYNDKDDIKLYVREEGINPSILKGFLDEYKRTVKTVNNIAMVHPENIEAAVRDSIKEVNIVKNEKYTDSKMDTFTGYFYALIAMTCLFGCFAGVTSSCNLKANLTALGRRITIAPTKRNKMLLAEICADVIVQFVCAMIAIFYLIYVLKVPFGTNMPFIMLIVLIGVLIGTSTGLFIGSISKKNYGFKIGMSSVISMTECFLSGLMVLNMYYIIQEYCPILNKINPAALIVNSFYCLDIYPTYEQFGINIISLAVIAALLCIGSFIAIRRERYASI